MNGESPLVTLGLCTKNNASTIKSTIESILFQDYPSQKLQLIVVDGLSSDGTPNIVKSILETASLNWNMLSDEGKGLAFARQLVVNNSSGKYVIWVDGDHILYPNFVSKHVDFMERNPHVGAAEGFMEYVATNLPSKLEGYSWYIYCLRRLDKDLKTVGAAGTIYRLAAIKSVGGFDIRIKGAGEDGDISHRMRNFGWKLRMNPDARFKHVMRTSWRSLWREYHWWGYGSHFTFHKHRGLVNPYRFLPPIAFLSGIRLGMISYSMTRDISCLLMPLHYSWKRTAWTLGFIKAHFNGYGHNKNTDD
ncbi:MAG: glycosyltransferase [Nitrososphaerota archaeon]|nr:glycosyltransferase [Nitrososphaerota archaeon]